MVGLHHRKACQLSIVDCCTQQRPLRCGPDDLANTCRLIGHLDQHGNEYAAEETGTTEAGGGEAADKHGR